MVPFHPLVVHLPVGLLFTSMVFFGLDLFLKKKFLQDAAFWMLLSGVAGAVLAIISGNIAEADIVNTREIRELTELHETLSMIAGWLFGILLVWQLLRREKQSSGEKIVFFLALLLSVSVLAFSSHLGGRIVYEKGGGVEPMRKPLEQQQQREQTKDKLPGEETV